MAPRARTRHVVLASIWAAAVIGGFAVLFDYQNTPGHAAEVPASWPAGSRLERSDDRLSLVVFMHPHCPCSMATLHELERMMTRVHRRVAARVVFVHPPGVDDEWGATALRAAVSDAAELDVEVDVDGVEAARFGAATSGQVYLFAPDGVLLFSGGVTSSRAHEGDNLGRLAIESIARGEEPLRRETPVFGCPLYAPNERP